MVSSLESLRKPILQFEVCAPEKTAETVERDLAAVYRAGSIGDSGTIEPPELLPILHSKNDDQSS
jgi:hypothetical protein